MESLRDHGEEVVVLLPTGIQPWRNPKRVMSKFAAKLTDFDPIHDRIVWAGGDTLAALMIGYLLCELEVDNILWLKWERVRDAAGNWTDEGGYYREVPISLYEESRVDDSEPLTEEGDLHDE